MNNPHANSPTATATEIDPQIAVDLSGDGDAQQKITRYLRRLGSAAYYYQPGGENQILWRGQDLPYRVTPSAHTRIDLGNRQLDDESVVDYTEELLRTASSYGFGGTPDLMLPDLPLLALLQHHGAATPLLDVSVDPLVALLMATGPRHAHKDGVLVAVPNPPRRINTWDDRPFAEIYAEATSGDALMHYEPPFITSRLRIQRGSFLLGKVSDQRNSSIKLDIARDDDLWKRIEQRPAPAENPQPPLISFGTVIQIPSKFKEELHAWIKRVARLDIPYVYPERLSSRFADDFAAANGRSKPWPVDDDAMRQPAAAPASENGHSDVIHLQHLVDAAPVTANGSTPSRKPLGPTDLG